MSFTDRPTTFAPLTNSLTQTAPKPKRKPGHTSEAFQKKMTEAAKTLHAQGLAITSTTVAARCNRPGGLAGYEVKTLKEIKRLILANAR